ncbi:MAG TPA: TIGR00730 family Rossman fold protein [Gammaproteobacteria bacterium]|nr:TIGR00730 family Rossman fold protein [Gammaproteobacteria bacterium]
MTTSICVFCGSRSGTNLMHIENAKILGETLAENNITLVYGGASVGTMGVLADAVLSKSGNVIGIMPNFLIQKEIKHNGLSAFHAVDSMSERKDKLIELADAFIVLPGGCGTLEEFSDVFSRLHLGLHNKPIGILNTDNFYRNLIEQLSQMVQQGFLPEKSYAKIMFKSDPRELVRTLMEIS